MKESRANSGARILLVDDEPDHVEMYRYALESAGLVVLSASSGKEALSQVPGTSPDLIVLDIRMPDMSGWEVCAALKGDPATAAIPIIILTAAASATLAAETVDAGCAAFLLKPCYPEDLIAAIREILAGT